MVDLLLRLFLFLRPVKINIHVVIVPSLLVEGCHATCIVDVYQFCDSSFELAKTGKS